MSFTVARRSAMPRYRFFLRRAAEGWSGASARIAQLNRVKMVSGGMGEWLKPAVLRTVELERVPGVRIPLPPPLLNMRFGCVVLLLAPFVSAQPPGPPPRPAAPLWDTAAVERGRAQFKSSCGFCHGDDATGNRAPDLVRSTALGHDSNGEVLTPLIRSGRPDQGMPAFSTLTPRQISDIVAFLHHQLDDALASNHV